MKLFTPKMRDFDRLGRSDPYPMHKLKRVERPTTRIDDALVQRVDERESGFNRAGRGDFGPKLKKEYFRFVNKHPLSSALLNMGFALRKQVDGEVADKIAPLPDNPLQMTTHIKETAYFLRADLVGICECCFIDNCIRIKYRYIGKVSLNNRTAVFEAKFFRRHRCHFLYGRGKIKTFLLAAIFAQDPGKSTIISRMWFACSKFPIRRYGISVRTDHDQ